MESTNLHSQNQLQEQSVAYSSFASVPPRMVSTTSYDQCSSPNLILDDSSLTIHEFSCYYTNHGIKNNELVLPRMKGEVDPEMRLYNSSSYTNDMNLSYSMDSQRCGGHENNPWFNFSSSSSSIYPSDRLMGDFKDHVVVGSTTDEYTHVSPWTNGSTLDLLSSRNYYDAISLKNYSSYDKIGQMQHYSIDSPSNFSNKITSTATKRKRAYGSNESKECQSEAKKSSCSKAGSSCPPLKVRKEKLGDRITALQRLVAPFGKTDTASVLTEAIGYIQFLHDQVQTLSVPYMKSSYSFKPLKNMQLGSSEEGESEMKQNLRNRGLCLVPLSFASYISGYD